LTEETEKKDNPYLKIGFWNGLAYTTAFVILFPWSLLYLLIFRGIENTKDFLVFFVRDLLITVILIILIIVPAIYYLISWIAQFFS
jgi:exosortase F-associated protein|tara:strand:- start:999 stop:1256 length:258 start_codon:yes stop_codon:yes gene_type:complete